VDFDTDPFDSLYRHLDCPKCGEHIVVGLSNNIKKYGFECPFCGAITNADSMWEAILESRMTGSSED